MRRCALLHAPRVVHSVYSLDSRELHCPGASSTPRRSRSQHLSSLRQRPARHLAWHGRATLCTFTAAARAPLPSSRQTPSALPPSLIKPATPISRRRSRRTSPPCPPRSRSAFAASRASPSPPTPSRTLRGRRSEISRDQPRYRRDRDLGAPNPRRAPMTPNGTSA